MDIHGSGRRLTRKQTTSRPDTTNYSQECGNMCRKRRSEEKSKSGLSKNRSLTMLEKCVVFTSLIQQMRCSKKLFKNARRKSEVPMLAAMPCRTRRKEKKDTCSALENRETKHACIVEADESTRRRVGGTLHKGNEDHIAGRGSVH